MKTRLFSLPPQRNSLLLLPIGLLVLGLGACTTLIDDSKVETAISDGIKEQTSLVVESVICPEDMKAKAGDSFECDVIMPDGQSFKAQVEQENDDGDVRWDAQEGLQSLKGVINNEILEEQITQGIAEQLNIQVSVDCGPNLTILRKGDSQTCAATDSKNVEKTVRVVAADDEGNVDWKLE